MHWQTCPRIRPCRWPLYWRMSLTAQALKKLLADILAKKAKPPLGLGLAPGSLQMVSYWVIHPSITLNHPQSPVFFKGKPWELENYHRFAPQVALDHVVLALQKKNLRRTRWIPTIRSFGRATACNGWGTTRVLLPHKLQRMASRSWQVLNCNWAEPWTPHLSGPGDTFEQIAMDSKKDVFAT